MFFLLDKVLLNVCLCLYNGILMTSDIKYCISARNEDPTAQICIKIDQRYKRQKCRPMTLVSENNKVHADICGGSPGRRRQTKLGVVDDGNFWRFRWLTSSKITEIRQAISWLYATHCQPITDCKMNDLEWLFHVKIRATSSIRAFERQKIIQPLRFCGVLCIARSVSEPR